MAREGVPDLRSTMKDSHRHRTTWGPWLAALFIAFAGAAHALDSERAIRQFPHVWYENQLPQATVLSIVQRRDGSIWLATYAGLARYSGAEFEGIDRRTQPVLRSIAITALLEDHEGTLWIGTLNGGFYRARDDRFEEVPLGAPMDSVFGLVEDHSGALWLATNAGIARRDASGLHRIDGFPPPPYRALAADPDGGVWIAIDGSGVAHWHDGKVDVLGVAQGLPSLAVYALRIDTQGTLWAGTQLGLVRYRDGRFEHDARAAALDGQRIYALQGDRDGNLWITAQGLGLCRLGPEHLDCDRSLRGLGSDIVRAMLEDREGNLWIGTTNGGVHRISESKLITVTGALESNSVRAVYEDARGELWIGTDGAGLARYRDHALVAFERNAQLPSPFLRSLAGDAAGNLWVGTIEGLTRIAPDGTLRSFRVDDGRPGAIVFAIAPRREGGVWIGTTRGLARVVNDVVTPIAGTRSDDIRSLYEAPDGRLWIGQRSGLHCLVGDALDHCGTDGLAETSVFAFHPAPDGSLWLGTSQGLMRWRDGAIAPYGERIGLLGDAVFTILDDGANNLWVGTNRGIARIGQRDIAALDAGTVASVAPTWFGKSDGMLSQQGNGASQTPGWRAHDGRLWIGTTNGVVVVDPKRLRGNETPPPVSVERLVVDGRAMDPHGHAAIGPGVERVEIHYAGMSYVAPESVRYRYKLEGFDRDWIDAGSQRTAYYTNLPPGDYTFQAIASNNDGVWNETGARASFSIRPSLQETAWFRALLLLAAAGAFVGIYRIRVWRLRANERALMREVALRTEELRAANDQLRRLASLDGLTRIANRGAFDEVLARRWSEHRNARRPLALLLCDIDAFKAYNDTYGHQAGDAALIRVAAALAALARSDEDLAARYGGEEFALLLAGCDAREAGDIAQRVLDAVRGLGIRHDGSGVAPRITISIGIAAFVPERDDHAELIVRRADEALYRAKANGRDRASI
ncbi:MAG TPA: two-component regulator propeller domain-containing protein [Rudaea sp.]